MVTNWLECPFCKKEREKLLDELFRELARKQFELLTNFVKKYNLNVDGIKYIVYNYYLESNNMPEIDSDMQIETLRVDYDYGINEKKCWFRIIFECEKCNFKIELSQTKKVKENDNI